VSNVGGPAAAYTLYVPRRNRGPVAVVPAAIPSSGLPINRGIVQPPAAEAKRRTKVFADN